MFLSDAFGWNFLLLFMSAVFSTVFDLLFLTGVFDDHFDDRLTTIFYDFFSTQLFWQFVLTTFVEIYGFQEYIIQ